MFSGVLVAESTVLDHVTSGGKSVEVVVVEVVDVDDEIIASDTGSVVSLSVTTSSDNVVSFTGSESTDVGNSEELAAAFSVVTSVTSTVGDDVVRIGVVGISVSVVFSEIVVGAVVVVVVVVEVVVVVDGVVVEVVVDACVVVVVVGCVVVVVGSVDVVVVFI